MPRAQLHSDAATLLRRYGPAGPDVPVPLVPDEASGAQFSAGDSQFLDFANGSILPLGYRHPALTEVLTRTGHLPAADGTAWPQQAELARKLAELVPGGMNRRILLADSGREALAQAISLARQVTGRKRVVYLDDRSDLAAADTAIVIGHPFDPRMPEASAACTSTGALLASDETTTGPGLSGRMFGIEHSGIRPDLYILGRGWAGGMPFGACVTGSSKLRWPGYVAGCSGASAAASLKTIELLEAGLLQQSAEAAALLARGLATSCPMPGAISGHGLVLTISLDSKVDAARVVQHCLSQGLLLRWLSDNSFGLRPPLVAAVPEIESALRILGQVLKSILSCA